MEIGIKFPILHLGYTAHSSVEKVHVGLELSRTSWSIILGTEKLRLDYKTITVDPQSQATCD